MTPNASFDPGLYRHLDGVWSCTRPRALWPCGACDGCRQVFAARSVEEVRARARLQSLGIALRVYRRAGEAYEACGHAIDDCPHALAFDEALSQVVAASPWAEEKVLPTTRTVAELEDLLAWLIS